MMQWLQFWICLCIAGIGLNGQTQMEITARLDTNAMLIGSRNALHIEWSGPNTLERIRIQSSAWDSISGLSWLEEIPVVHEQKKELHRYSKRLPFTVFDTLSIDLPQLVLSWKEKKQNQQIRVGGFTLRVNPPEERAEDWSPNQPIIREPLRWEDYRLYLFGLALLIGLYLLYRYYKNTRVVRDEEQWGEPMLDPHEEAFRALRTLESKEHLREEQYEAFQLELSRIIRQFLSRKYEIAAMESTTREILDQLKKTPFPSDQLPLVKELLSMADLVKFARAEPPGDFHRRMLGSAYQMVEFTNTIRS